MFSIRRKIGTGATTRRRPSRECKVGVECMETRAVPAIIVPTPGSPLLESGLGTAGVPTILNVAFDEHGHASASLTTTNPFNGAVTTSSTMLASNVGPTGTLTAIPGVTGPGTANPLTLAYRLPTPVQAGDVVVRDFQTGQISDLLRFQTASDPVQGTQGYLLVYSDTGEPALPGTAPENAPADVGIPTPAASVLTQSAIEFGVEGFNTIEYAAEQANYSGLSDGNAVPFGTDPVARPAAPAPSPAPAGPQSPAASAPGTPFNRRWGQGMTGPGARERADAVPRPESHSRVSHPMPSVSRFLSPPPRGG